MTSNASTPEEYINELPEERKEVISKLRDAINKNLPKGFEEGMGYGMLSYHIPHSIYPYGYHCTPELPLPFMNLASQKNFVAVYHMGIDRKSTRLNSIHVVTSYAVFCSKKKTKNHKQKF